MMTSDGVEGFDSFKGGVHARTGKLNGSFRTIVRKIGVLVPGFEPGSKE